MKYVVLLVVVCLSIVSASGVSAQDADLAAIKVYAEENAAQMKEATEAFLASATDYFDRVKAATEQDSADPYAILVDEQEDEITQLVLDLRQTWFDASLYYELNEGIVAGTPSLEFFDVIIDAGPSVVDDPDEALEWTLVLPDGTELESPGNLFHSLSEPAIYGTDPELVASSVELETEDGEVIRSLPDANFLLGVAQRLDEETGNLVTAIDEWDPTLEDAFHALVVMIPTMNEYFGQWRESVFVAGDNAEETAFVGTSRLFDIVNILNGLRVTYDNVSPELADVEDDLDGQIAEGFDNLQGFVGDVFEQEQEGVVFEAEEVDLLGTEAQNSAEELAALVTQAADVVGVELELE